MTINAANLQIRLSGGAGNANPMLALGGAMSATSMSSQTPSVLISVTGVTITFAGGLSVGQNNQIRHIKSGAVHTLELKDYLDGTFGPAVDVSAGGVFFLTGSNHGAIAVNVAQGSLPATSQTENFTVTNVKNNLFDDILKLDALNGTIDYRCVYLYNNHPTEAFLSVGVYGYGATGNPATAGDKLWVGADPAGAGNGSTTGVATSIPDEWTAPTGVTFSSPEITSVLALGAIQPLEARAIWLRRNVPASLFAVTPDDVAVFGLRLIF